MNYDHTTINYYCSYSESISAMNDDLWLSDFSLKIVMAGLIYMLPCRKNKTSEAL